MSDKEKEIDRLEGIILRLQCIKMALSRSEEEAMAEAIEIVQEKLDALQSE